MQARLFKRFITASLLCAATHAFSQEVTTFILKGQVVSVNDPSKLLDGAVKVGDALKGRIKFRQPARDENPDVTVGDYRYHTAPGGMWVKINDYLFRSDPQQRDFLVELVNRPPAQLGDAIVFRSYQNIFSVPIDESHVSWQLDDAQGLALTNVELPTNIDLAAWTQISGLTIRGEKRLPREGSQEFFIRATITKVLLPKTESALKDEAAEFESENLPAEFALQQNYPNPFNPSTTINYDLPEEGFVSLRIYDMLGKTVRTLVDDFQSAGMKSVRWEGKDELGHEVAAGIYIYRLEAEDFTQARKLVFVK